MKQIWRIYKTDLRNVAKHWAAIVIVVGLMILPSLYAWFNIKASWDPYGNTKEVPIAVSNQDAGSNLRGKDINIGDEIVDSLKKNKNLGWKFVDEKQAIYGVERGDYYASITIPKDFSEKIATVLDENPQKPELDYYVNEKVNAIAPKITAKGASGITEEISKNFVKTANGEIFKIFNDLGIDLETNLPSIEKVKDLVFKLEAQFPEMNTLMDKALDDATRAEDVVKVAQKELPVVESVINDGQDTLKSLDAFFARNDETLNRAPGTIKNNLIAMQTGLNGAAAITDFLKNPSVDFNLALPDPSKLPELPNVTIPQIPALPELPQVNGEGYKNIAKNINQTVNNVFSSIRVGTTYAQGVINGLQNGNFDPEKAKQDLNKVSENLQDRADSVSYVIDVFTKFKESASTDFGKEFFQKRIERLTSLKSAIENANGGVKDIANIIGTGQEVKQDVRDAANKKLDAINNLVNQAETDYNATFVADFEKAVSTAEQLKNKAEGVKEDAQQLRGNLNQDINKANEILNNGREAYDKAVNDYSRLKTELGKAREDLNNKGINGLDSTKVALNDIRGELQAGKNLVNDMIPVMENTNKVLADVNSDKNTNNMISKLNKLKDGLQKAIDLTDKGIDAINKGQKPAADVIESINAVSKSTSAQISDILAKYDSEIVPNFNEAIARTKEMSKNTSQILKEADKKLPDVKKILEDSSKGLVDGKKKLTDIKAEMPATEKKIKELADKIRDFESEEDLKDIIRLLKNDVEKQSDYFANPVNLKENKLFAMPNYGSAMSPFYTVLALWVGALLMVSLLTVEVHEEGANYKSHEIYFGRLLTFLTIGLSQAFIVSMGDIFLLGTYVVDKFWFVLFSLFIGGVFVCIVYSLVSIFGNVGKSMAIILLVLQVAGSGGTFPIQMTPKFFQAIYPFLPFTYAISAIRETVGGMLWDIVTRDLLVLSAFVVVMIVAALLLKTPINKSSEKFVENAKGSKIIH
ncbi:YhgE/Pip family protein [Bacillus paranthracis]|uniref:ABC-2 family transporter protein n=3 Tax=Bacillus cereus group TaxID=86661 RepID=A0A5M9GNH3_9BACI|nr:MULTISPECIES: YhgE/Pip domain-containing protein [Bacillus]ACJ81907.1 phage infection protein [Bacillus cereus AH187]ACM10920.1 possible phage infection protein-like membrane protein [Bacillus cereus Q1]EEL02432.1 Phage infection protein [Bacillus cereus BDRD-ST26]EJP85680.1 YhgE/Pip domain-containing protein [Bacillus cereus IS075]EJP99372.1 YhgE/Pip domain-containing protein [Bacillus cereus AND1407]EJR07573.1 YhgE/Pip domain-containing protein [Bacillus cereus MSX-A12]EOO91044.1 YhgE/P